MNVETHHLDVEGTPTETMAWLATRSRRALFTLSIPNSGWVIEAWNGAVFLATVGDTLVYEPGPHGSLGSVRRAAA